MLRERKILLGVCGSIAAYKAAELVRALVREQAQVQVVMTPSATRFIGPATMAALSGRPVHADLFASPERVIHVEVARWADAFVVCGATASTLARLATGSGDDIVSASYLMCRCPVLIAPAMHTEMWEHAAVQRNLARLAADGVVQVPPGVGDLASGDFGVGRLAETNDIVEAAHRALTPQDLAGIRALITSGPTREPIDPVRFVSNRSSGRMGTALAVEARRRGAEVVFVTGPTAHDPPRDVEVVRVETAEEMHRECLQRLEGSDVIVKAAAVADHRPADVAAEKTKKEEAPPTLTLSPTPDIAAEVGRRKGSRILVLFAAETSAEVENATAKLEAKNADLVVANTVGKAGTGFDTETNDAALVSADGVERLPRMRKPELAHLIWDRIAKMMAERPGGLD